MLKEITTRKYTTRDDDVRFSTLKPLIFEKSYHKAIKNRKCPYISAFACV